MRNRNKSMDGRFEMLDAILFAIWVGGAELTYRHHRRWGSPFLEALPAAIAWPMVIGRVIASRMIREDENAADS